jgi:hypothetical protein
VHDRREVPRVVVEVTLLRRPRSPVPPQTGRTATQPGTPPRYPCCPSRPRAKAAISKQQLMAVVAARTLRTALRARRRVLTDLTIPTDAPLPVAATLAYQPNG